MEPPSWHPQKTNGLPFTAGEGGFAQTFGLEFNAMHRIVFLYYLILALALLTNFVTMRLRKLPGQGGLSLQDAGGAPGLPR